MLKLPLGEIRELLSVFHENFYIEPNVGEFQLLGNNLSLTICVGVERRYIKGYGVSINKYLCLIDLVSLQVVDKFFVECLENVWIIPISLTLINIYSHSTYVSIENNNSLCRYRVSYENIS